MILKATITSERGKPKWKSGNEYLNIEILVGDENNKEKIAEITVEHHDNEIREGKDCEVYQLWNFGTLVEEIIKAKM